MYKRLNTFRLDADLSLEEAMSMYPFEVDIIYQLSNEYKKTKNDILQNVLNSLGKKP